MIKSYDIANLDCAVCAGKIENVLLDQDHVIKANYNLVNKKLIIETSNHQALDETIIQNILDAIEPGSKIINAPIVQPRFDVELFRLIVSLLLLAVGIFIHQSWILLLAYGLGGYPIFIKSFNNILKGNIFDENFLMVIASLGAIFINEYVEAVAVMLFYGFGEYLQNRAVEKSRRNIQDLLDLDIHRVHKIHGDTMEDVEVSTIVPEDLLLVLVGEKIPVDGEIIIGSSLIDSSTLTGESLLQEVEIGDLVLAGSINQLAPLTIKATSIFMDSSVAKMKKMLDESALYQAEPEKFITKFSKVYTPIVLVLALAVAVGGPILFPEISRSDWLYRSLVFLVASCPCALVLSIPLTYFVGIGKSSRSNILVKGGQVLDDLVHLKKVVFDKTGTLTKGIFEVSEMHSTNPEKLLQYAASLEQYSNHPLSKAIIQANQQPLLKVSDPLEIAGRGISGIINHQWIHLGSTRYLQDEQISFEAIDTVGTMMHLAVDRVYQGSIELNDGLRETTLKTLKELKDENIETYILSGDNQKVVNVLKDQLAMNDGFGELLPQEKVEKFKWIKQSTPSKEKVMFVGDGINDSLVLQQADIGVAMGHQGADISIEVADMILMRDELEQILEAKQIAIKTRTIVLQNVTLALVSKAIVLILGAIGVAPMLLAVFADVGITLITLFNALRIFK